MRKNSSKTSKRKTLSLEEKRKSVVSKLKRGDLTRLSELIGYDKSHISRVLRGERNNDEIIKVSYSYLRRRTPVN